jgi:hypothetical protein
MTTAEFFNVTLGGFLGSGVAAAILGLVFLRHTKTLESEIKAQFDQRFKVFESTRTWKQLALAELFGPLYMQFERTKRAFGRWKGQNLYLEAHVVREGNQVARDLLLSKGHLLPPQLIEDAARLIEHYDAWLEAFDRIRGGATPAIETPFVFVGPGGYPFPKDAEGRLKAEFHALQKTLYGV